MNEMYLRLAPLPVDVDGRVVTDGARVAEAFLSRPDALSHAVEHFGRWSEDLLNRFAGKTAEDDITEQDVTDVIIGVTNALVGHKKTITVAGTTITIQDHDPECCHTVVGGRRYVASGGLSADGVDPTEAYGLIHFADDLDLFEGPFEAATTTQDTEA